MKTIREQFCKKLPLHLKAFASLASIVCCLMLSLAPAAGSVVGEVTINGLYSIGNDELLYLLGIRSGETVDADSVRRGIKRAFLKGIFDDISVEITDRGKGDVFVHIRERDRINAIHIEGDYALSKKTLRELFPLKEGQYLLCNELNKAVNDIKPELALRGFPHANVQAVIEPLKEPYRINIRLAINTGIPEVIKKIVISGAGDEMKSVMTLSEGDVFNQTVLQKDIEKIKNYYKNREYYKPVVSTPSFSNGTLSISLKTGKRLKVIIEGNDSISSRTLLKEMPFFEAEEFNEDIVEEALHRLLSVYHTGGYPMAQVAPVLTSQDDLDTITFFIYEGPRITVGKLTFTGNSLKEERLKEILSLKEGDTYNPDIIDADREMLQDFYVALGYLSASVSAFRTHYDESSQKMDIEVMIEEGAKTEIVEITVTGAKIVSDANIRSVIHLKKGDPYNDIDIYDARLKILELYNNKGFPNASVAIKTEIVDQKAYIGFTITEGAFTLFGKVIVTGNRDTDYRVVKRALLQNENEPFDYSILAKERQRLYKPGLFTDVEIQVLDQYDDKRDVLMKLHEGNAGSVEFGLGYADYEKYRGFLDISYRNLWGMNRQASTRFELSSLEQRIIFQYYEPWFMDRPLPFRASFLSEVKKELNIDTKDTLYRLTRHTATAGFEKKIGEHIKSELYYEFSLVNTYDVQSDVVLSKEDTGTLIISGIRLGVIYDTRDDPFYPAKGILSGITAKFTSPLFFSETDFLKLTAYYNIYHQVIKRLVLAASVRAGIAQGYLNTDELPIVERFFLGGRNTVRGYEQDTLGPKGSDGNPVGGNAFLMENLEARIALSKSLGLVAFVDGGNVWLKMDDIRPEDMKFTAGIGLRYNTPVGPLRVDYGYKLQRENGESAGEVHFSIGNAF